MIDVDPDGLKNCSCDFPALFFVRQCWIQMAGKHRSRDAAYDALKDMLATRH